MPINSVLGWSLKALTYSPATQPAPRLARPYLSPILTPALSPSFSSAASRVRPATSAPLLRPCRPLRRPRRARHPPHAGRQRTALAARQERWPAPEHTQAAPPPR